MTTKKLIFRARDSVAIPLKSGICEESDADVVVVFLVGEIPHAFAVAFAVLAERSKCRVVRQDAPVVGVKNLPRPSRSFATSSDTCPWRIGYQD